MTINELVLEIKKLSDKDRILFINKLALAFKYETKKFKNKK